MESLIRLRDGYNKMFRCLIRSMNCCVFVFAVLLAVTYASFSHSALDLALDGNKWEKLAYCLNGFSFFSAVCGLLISSAGAFLRLSLLTSQGLHAIDEEIATQQKRLAMALPKLVYVFMFLMLSIACCVLAYIFAGIAYVGERGSGKLPVIISCGLGGFVCIQAFIVSVTDIFELWRNIGESDAELWNAMKKGTLFGKTFAKYVEISKTPHSDTFV